MRGRIPRRGMPMHGYTQKFFTFFGFFTFFRSCSIGRQFCFQFFTGFREDYSDTTSSPNCTMKDSEQGSWPTPNHIRETNATIGSKGRALLSCTYISSSKIASNITKSSAWNNTTRQMRNHEGDGTDQETASSGGNA